MLDLATDINSIIQATALMYCAVHVTSCFGSYAFFLHSLPRNVIAMCIVLQPDASIKLRNSIKLASEQGKVRHTTAEYYGIT